MATQRATDASATAGHDLLAKEVPGSYGIPFISPIRDRLGFYYDGQDKFFQSRVDKYNSTVVRLNAPPGPFMASNPRVIALLDAKSFPVLFDVDKVAKRDLFTGTYMPSTALTGGFRVCAYLDPAEPKHAQLKQLLFTLLAARKDAVLPAFRVEFGALFDSVEAELDSGVGKSSDFNKLNDGTAFEFLGEAFFGVRPSATKLGSTGPSKSTRWLFLQLCPLMTLGLPKILEELLLHTFPLPPLIARWDYKALYKYISEAAASSGVLDTADNLGISRDEACHNLLFATVFNSYGGMKVLLPGIMGCLAKAGENLHKRLAKEIRAEVAAAGGKVTVAAVERMELTRSVVYEALRLDPPVKYQYGHAKRDLVIESHDGAYHVRSGEMLFGYQPFATRDPKVFYLADQFVPDRFVGEDGQKLLKYVVWSNGPETESPTVADKQCPGKDLVVLVGRLLVVDFFLRYDTFTAEVGTQLLGAQVNITSLAKASTSAASTDDN